MGHQRHRRVPWSWNLLCPTFGVDESLRTPTSALVWKILSILTYRVDGSPKTPMGAWVQRPKLFQVLPIGQTNDQRYQRVPGHRHSWILPMGWMDIQKYPQVCDHSRVIQVLTTDRGHTHNRNKHTNERKIMNKQWIKATNDKNKININESLDKPNRNKS